MKKYTCILALLIICMSARSQQQPIEINLLGGYSINSARGSAISHDVKSALGGFRAGAEVVLSLSKSFAGKTGLLYEQVGWAYHSLTFENTGGTGFVKADVLFKLNYINIPLEAVYTFGEKTRFYCDAGLFVGLLLKSKTITRPKEPSAGETISNSTPYRNTANFGIAVGAGVLQPLSSNIKLHIGLHNNLGLNNINKSQSNLKSSIQTNSFSVNAGITFTL